MEGEGGVDPMMTSDDKRGGRSLDDVIRKNKFSGGLCKIQLFFQKFYVG
jgi:hypothetical protein